MNLSSNWKPKKDWPTITCIDAHAAGEPLRVVIDGIPPLKGKTILAKRRFFRQYFDHIRTGLMWEPRGHADMYGAIITEPEKSTSDIGVIFLHNEGYSTMCGHGIIALTKVLVDTGIIKKSNTIHIDTPAGLIIATAEKSKNEVAQVSFQNVPSFVYLAKKHLMIPKIGLIQYDIAFGGAFYIFCQARDLNLKITSENYPQIIQWGKQLKTDIIKTTSINHPLENDLGFLYGTIFIDRPNNNSNHSRNVCVFADGEVDRSPTGTGVSARAAIHFFRGEITQNQSITIESIVDSLFKVKIIDVSSVGPYKAVIPEVTGSAFIISENKFFFDPSDPFKKGFFLR